MKAPSPSRTPPGPDAAPRRGRGGDQETPRPPPMAVRAPPSPQGLTEAWIVRTFLNACCLHAK